MHQVASGRPCTGYMIRWGSLESFWATNEKNTQLPKKPRRLKKALRE